MVAKVTGSMNSPGFGFFLAIFQRPPVDVISKPCRGKSQLAHQHCATGVIFQEQGGSGLNTLTIEKTQRKLAMHGGNWISSCQDIKNPQVILRPRFIHFLWVLCFDWFSFKRRDYRSKDVPLLRLRPETFVSCCDVCSLFTVNPNLFNTQNYIVQYTQM